MKIDVILNPAEIASLDAGRLRGVVCVVFDVLRATSCMITALASGAREIYPVRTVEEARALKAGLPDAILGGERLGERIEGFDVGNSPFEYRERVAGRIITTTTNGTAALCAAAPAAETLVGALLNMGALTGYLRKRAPESVVLLCAGTFEFAALEDIFAAGMLCAAFPDAELTDSAIVAATIFEKYQAEPVRCLFEARNGQTLMAKGRRAEVEWCGQVSVYEAIGRVEEGVIRRLDGICQ